jgi:nitrile hydratase
MATNHVDSSPARRVRHLEAVLERKGLVSGEQLDAIIDQFLASASPLNGARIIARAWCDSAFKERLLDDGNAAIAELGYTMGDGVDHALLRVVENTEACHNVVVCTLCSCYPMKLLGPSPSWYKHVAYRSRVVRDPRSVLAEFGLSLPPDVDVRVWDASAETRYLVLPRRPEGTDRLSEDDLTTLVTRNGMIGTALV